MVAHCRDSGRHLLGEAKWSAKAATAASLRAAHTQLLARGVPPFVRGEVVRALFVPVLPRERPNGLPENLVLVDAEAVLAAIGDDEG